MADEKYKLFRNFMANELGITREDIKDWTQYAATEVAKKAVGQINISGIVVREARKHEYDIRSQVVSEVAKELASRLVIRDT